jgi:hypothetical protein
MRNRIKSWTFSEEPERPKGEWGKVMLRQNGVVQPWIHLCKMMENTIILYWELQKLNNRNNWTILEAFFRQKHLKEAFIRRLFASEAFHAIQPSSEPSVVVVNVLYSNESEMNPK